MLVSIGKQAEVASKQIEWKVCDQCSMVIRMSMSMSMSMSNDLSLCSPSISMLASSRKGHISRHRYNSHIRSLYYYCACPAVWVKVSFSIFMKLRW
jgi:hypothetical protein